MFFGGSSACWDGPVLCQSWLDTLGAMGGLPALTGPGADKLPLEPVNPELTEHYFLRLLAPHFARLRAALTTGRAACRVSPIAHGFRDHELFKLMVLATYETR
jgi:hypothetical protein